jgi:hypothetical protein
MTFQNSEISNTPNFEIIIEDQKVYFSDYPDFPIFEKTMFPDEAWALMEINFDQICMFVSQMTQQLIWQYERLNQEFENCDTHLERSKLLKDRRENDAKLYARYQQLIDPSYETPPLEQETLDLNFPDLHIFVKYILSQPDLIDQYDDVRVYMLLGAIYEQGYDLDICTGEIINHVTGETIQESHF